MMRVFLLFAILFSLCQGNPCGHQCSTESDCTEQECSSCHSSGYCVVPPTSAPTTAAPTVQYRCYSHNGYNDVYKFPITATYSHSTWDLFVGQGRQSKGIYNMTLMWSSQNEASLTSYYFADDREVGHNSFSGSLQAPQNTGAYWVVSNTGARFIRQPESSRYSVIACSFMDKHHQLAVEAGLPDEGRA